MENERAYQICTRCIMDTSDPEIVFDEHGICNHCREIEAIRQQYPHNLSPEEKHRALQEKVTEIQQAGKGGKYDCVIGVSGGIDSTYVAYLTKQLGLRPLAVHLDNGWNSELAVHNIEKICKQLDIDLYTYVLDWEEFRDLQVAFLKASTPDSEIPTDHAIHGLLYQTAAQHSIKYMIIGCNFRTESVLPRTWSHGHYDWKYIQSLHKLYGKVPLKTYPNLSYPKWFYYKMLRGIRYFTILDYVEYVKEDAKKTLQEHLEWEDYGGKHHESLYTKFFQSYILPTKFGFDKRRMHLASLIGAGQLSRDQALQEMQQEIYPPAALKEDKEYVIKKLGLTAEEFQEMMNTPPKTFWDYPSYETSRVHQAITTLYKSIKDRKENPT
ncbi:N-acetyl sugar amidotransferase [candidate division KSB3 bacterium]|uniref:N-acetyl sugar amidotransferase n=1 Tax=candidate division KSB3 bacterium TaxID=2044937 RepID=A0A9D5Q651_9BACT|nr:N-acetyl sugar amidotransferase [candidate division KSB3 bacterium]MBD3324912.1 N-acetyl sugar amidotransferase [candidate division KSB3 bacterium]